MSRSSFDWLNVQVHCFHLRRNAGIPRSPSFPSRPGHPGGPTAPVDPGIPGAPGVPGDPGVPGVPAGPCKQGCDAWHECAFHVKGKKNERKGGKK